MHYLTWLLMHRKDTLQSVYSTFTKCTKIHKGIIFCINFKDIFHCQTNLASSKINFLEVHALGIFIFNEIYFM